MPLINREAGPLQLLIAILDRYREPLFVIDDTRHILFSNTAGARVLRDRGGLSEQRGCLTLGNAAADQRLRKIILSATSGAQRRRSRGIRVVRPKSARDWLLLIHPLADGSAANDHPPLFFVQGLGRMSSRDAQVLALADLFDLTLREVSVARELLRTGSVPAAAAALALSRETIRTYLKRIFRKCDIHSRTELQTILLWLGEFPGRN